jgi:hypothetical protein
MQWLQGLPRLCWVMRGSVLEELDCDMFRHVML